MSEARKIQRVQDKTISLFGFIQTMDKFRLKLRTKYENHVSGWKQCFYECMPFFIDNSNDFDGRLLKDFYDRENSIANMIEC